MDFYSSEMILKFANSFPMTQLCLRTYFDDMLLFQLAKYEQRSLRLLRQDKSLMETMNRKKVYCFILNGFKTCSYLPQDRSLLLV